MRSFSFLILLIICSYCVVYAQKFSNPDPVSELSVTEIPCQGHVTVDSVFYHQKRVDEGELRDDSLPQVLEIDRVDFEDFISSVTLTDLIQHTGFGMVIKTRIYYDEPKANLNGVLQELFIDIYLPLCATRHKHDLFVFVHGGGFNGESADNAGSVKLCKRLCKKDYAVASVEYRRGFDHDYNNDGDTEGCDIDPMVAMAAIDTAISDFRQALDSLLSPQTKQLFNFTNRVFAYGKSAGGALVAMAMLADDFEQAPYIKGAIIGKGGVDFQINSFTIPLILLHNQNDQASPYYIGSLFNCDEMDYTVYGGAWIYEQYTQHGGRARLITSCWSDHGTDYYNNIEMLLSAYDFFRYGGPNCIITYTENEGPFIDTPCPDETPVPGF